MKKYLASITLDFIATILFPQPTAYTMDASKPMADVQPTMWGVFF